MGPHEDNYAATPGVMGSTKGLNTGLIRTTNTGTQALLHIRSTLKHIPYTIDIQ